jgi:hypothetical protein
MVTVDEQRREVPDGGMIVRARIIETVAPYEDLESVEWQTLDLTAGVGYPLLVEEYWRTQRSWGNHICYMIAIMTDAGGCGRWYRA